MRLYIHDGTSIQDVSRSSDICRFNSVHIHFNFFFRVRNKTLIKQYVCKLNIIFLTIVNRSTCILKLSVLKWLPLIYFNLLLLFFCSTVLYVKYIIIYSTLVIHRVFLYIYRKITKPGKNRIVIKRNASVLRLFFLFIFGQSRSRSKSNQTIACNRTKLVS